MHLMMICRLQLIDLLTAWARLWQAGSYRLLYQNVQVFELLIHSENWLTQLITSCTTLRIMFYPFLITFEILVFTMTPGQNMINFISLIVHKAYIRAVLILKCFRSRDLSILMQVFCVYMYVRPLLEFSSHVWSPHHKYLIDKVESVQRFFTINVYQDFEGYLIVRD